MRFIFIKQSAIITVLIMLFSLDSPAQDIQFSQFYAAALYQNPAFAGTTHNVRAILHQRIQWPKLNSKYMTSLLSVDKYFANARSGAGLMFIKDYQGGTNISSTEIGAMYSYEIYLNSRYTFRPGLQLNYVTRYVNYADARFPHGHNDDGFQGNYIDYGNSRVHFADVSTGGIFYSDKLWIGFSAHHINTPNQSVFGEVTDLPAKFAFTGGYKFLLSNSGFKTTYDQKEVSITPTAHYKFQGKADQLDIGIYGVYDQLKAGFWYRGIPVKKLKQDLHNNESLIFLVGWKYQSYAISYSYDFGISKLATIRTGGAHEINLTIIPKPSHKKHKPMRRLPCPRFRDTD
ncbi:MAG TPA: type IX secretion system membrane protein PorP/SprF [Cytophagaceae bacterium]